jgi:hypothetical protein
VGEEVRARAEVLRLHASKPVATLSTRCFGAADGRLLMDGSATVMIPQPMYDASMAWQQQQQQQQQK